MSRLFSIRPSQASCPVAVVGLSIDPTWDDAPTPLSWKDFQDILFHFGTYCADRSIFVLYFSSAVSLSHCIVLGNALQLLLGQKAKVDRSAPYYLQPSDVSDFLGAVSKRALYVTAPHIIILKPFSRPEFDSKFMVLWLYNDGFLQRVAQLSQDQFTFQQELMRVLREDFKKSKAISLTENIFKSTLELVIFTNFDPRGDETIFSLQDRVAQKYVPYDVPGPHDLSPMIDILQGKTLDPAVATYTPIWSEILACMVYRKFIATDLKDTEAVAKLGEGIRNLFLSPDTSSREHFESLCDEKISLKSLKHLHSF